LGKWWGTDLSEHEWLGCTDPQQMLELLKGTVSNRKLRLFIAGCCHLLGLQQTEEGRFGLDVAARLAEVGGSR
jgi:hypothetical protein